MISPSDKATYKVFASSGEVSIEVLDRALKSAETGKKSFWRILSELSGLSDQVLFEVLTKQTGIPVVSIKKMPVDPKAQQKVPVKIAWYYKFFPYKIQDGKIAVAFSQVPDTSVLDEIRFGIGIDVSVGFAPERDIEEMLNKHYGLGADMVNKIVTQTAESAPAQGPASTHHVEDIEQGEGDTASISRLVNQIILDAFKKRASDIHLEPYRGKVRIRYRIDGVLHEAPVPPEMRQFFNSIQSRIKIMANLNVVEKRLPQDGKMRVKTQDQNLDLRISCIPTAHGESIVIRLLSGKNTWTLDGLGFEPQHLSQIKELLDKPNGIIFATGPTGSGKSTTLYGCLTALNSEGRKIITIEDPVEYELEGVSQIQVATDVGLTFSEGLRSILRHDPDVLMVGEVRDLETADIAIRAALTGHLILSTLHTNDAASGITRLGDIGVEKYLIASSVIAFIAQRLVRVICPHCKIERRDLDEGIKKVLAASLGLHAPDEIKTYQGKGCDHCNMTGYSGRKAIHELLIINDEIRKMIMDGAPAGEIKKNAMRGGMQSLRQDGFKKVLQGVTTPEEIMRIAPADHAEAVWKNESAGEVSAVYLPASHASAGSSPEKNKPGKESDSEADMRRKYKRIQTQLSVTYRVIESSAQHPQFTALRDLIADKDWEGEAQNLSAGGLLYSSEASSLGPSAGNEVEMSVNDAIDAGTVLDLHIHLTDGEKPVHCIGRVLRANRAMRPTEEGSRFVFQIAVLFLVINSHDRMRIEKFCESHGSVS